jgi:hypothetical protein
MLKVDNHIKFRIQTLKNDRHSMLEVTTHRRRLDGSMKKVKFALEHAMKTQKGSTGIALLFL